MIIYKDIITGMLFGDGFYTREGGLGRRLPELRGVLMTSELLHCSTVWVLCVYFVDQLTYTAP
jgi:hypothetical protein